MPPAQGSLAFFLTFFSPANTKVRRHFYSSLPPISMVGASRIWRNSPLHFYEAALVLLVPRKLVNDLRKCYRLFFTCRVKKIAKSFSCFFLGKICFSLFALFVSWIFFNFDEAFEYAYVRIRKCHKQC